jgi:hypothetical protein
MVTMMIELPGHTSPNYSESSREDALFHYTTGNGLLGILKNNEIWSTAYYCANDESELSVGKGVLAPIFRSKTFEMINGADPRVYTFRSHGVDIREYGDKFEQFLFGFALNILCVYITCFCKPNGQEDFRHGLLSQWRGYGADGGYALQFSRAKLQQFVDNTNKYNGLCYELQDVYYSPDNPLKAEVLKHANAFTGAYTDHLDELADSKILQKKTMKSPISSLSGGPLESLLDYIIHTKSEHFSEEKECRMSVLKPVSAESAPLAVDYFNRNGLIVPFVKTPVELNILDCVEWIIVGPGPRIVSRFNAVKQMVKNMGLKMQVRPSHIPLVRS